MATETIVLDPSEVSTSRTELDINTGAITVRAEGVDWGNAEIQQYAAEQARGSSPVDFRIPNRNISIPLILQTSGTVSFAQARSKVAAKVARIQQEGGWIKRVTSGGGTLFADVVNASLTLPGGWLQAHQSVENEAMLTLEAIPDFYGDEVALGDHVETSAAELIFTETGIKGDYPGRVRIVVDDDEGQNQRGLIWGFQSRHYTSASTNLMAYEAEALQALDTAAAAAKVGASGGTIVTHGTVSTNWTPVVGTNIAGTSYLTHTGTNRIFARVFTTSGTAVQSRFVWDVGDLVFPAENDAVRCYDGGTFHILDFGEVRLDPVPTGAHRWAGQIQAKGDIGTENFSVDRVWIVNADEGMGVLRAPFNSGEGLTTYSARSEFNTESGAITGDALAVGGTWTGAGDADDFSVAVGIATRTAVSDSGGFSTGRVITASTPTLAAVAGRLDFMRSVAIGSTAFQGLVFRYVDVNNFALLAISMDPALTYANIYKVIGGSAQTIVNRVDLPPLAVAAWHTIEGYISASGVATMWLNGQFLMSGSDSALATGETLDDGKVGILDWQSGAGANTRTYDNFAAWVPTDDAVLFASQSAELSTLGITREDSTGAAYGPVSITTGDRPRIPPAGLEGRSTKVFLKASRGDLQGLNDPSMDDISARVYYRPSYLLVPES